MFVHFPVRTISFIMHVRTDFRSYRFKLCTISNMKKIFKCNSCRSKFSHENRKFVHKLIATIVELNSVSQKKSQTSTVVITHVRVGIFLYVLSYVYYFRAYDCTYAYLLWCTRVHNCNLTQHKTDLANQFDAKLIGFPESNFTHKSTTTFLILIPVYCIRDTGRRGTRRSNCTAEMPAQYRSLRLHEEFTTPDFRAHPIAPAGIRVLVHDKPD